MIGLLCLIIGNFLVNAIMYAEYREDFKWLRGKLGKTLFPIFFLMFGSVILGGTLIALVMAWLTFLCAEGLLRTYEDIRGKGQDE